jgi:hypothetical protein
MAESFKNAFESFRVIRTKVTEWDAGTFEDRAELANRHRKSPVFEEGSRVPYRDPPGEIGLGGGVRGRNRSLARVSWRPALGTSSRFAVPTACWWKPLLRT